MVASAAAARVRKAILAVRPLYYYPCDELAGTVARDASVNGNDGTWGATVQFGHAGPAGRAVRVGVDATSDLQISDSLADIAGGTGLYTLFMLIQVYSWHGAGAFDFIFAHQTSGGVINDARLYRLGTTNTINIEHGGGATSNEATAFGPGVWVPYFTVWNSAGGADSGHHWYGAARQPVTVTGAIAGSNATRIGVFFRDPDNTGRTTDATVQHIFAVQRQLSPGEMSAIATACNALDLVA